jgi:hypothetical protein
VKESPFAPIVCIANVANVRAGINNRFIAGFAVSQQSANIVVFMCSPNLSGTLVFTLLSLLFDQADIDIIWIMNSNFAMTDIRALNIVELS